jgi:hypothetical protein
MNAIVKRIGYFLREVVKGTTAGEQNRFYIIRYFLIDNQHGIYYTENFAQLIQVIKTSKSLKEAFEKADKELKRIKISEVKASEVKKYTQPEILSFLNKVYIDVSVSMNSDLADNSTLTGAKGEDVKKFLFFTFKDHHLPALQKFLSTYEKTITLPSTKEEEVEVIEWEEVNQKEVNRKQQLEKSLQDKLESLAEQLSHVKEIEDALSNMEINKKDLGLKKPTAVVEEGMTKDGDHNGAQESPVHIETTEGLVHDSKAAQIDSTGVSPTESTTHNSPGRANYSGPLVGGKAEGKGKEHINDKISYVGDYKEGNRHGVGYFVLANQGMCYVESINGRIAGI